MRRVYGQSRVERCPFCGELATSKNKQGVTVCRNHKESLLPDMKCACGEYLDIKEGKYGYFFLCMNCGPVSSRKAYEMNEVIDAKPVGKPKHRTETTIRSDDPDYF